MIPAATDNARGCCYLLSTRNSQEVLCPLRREYGLRAKPRGESAAGTGRPGYRQAERLPFRPTAFVALAANGLLLHQRAAGSRFVMEGIQQAV
jgi:hypothetical protein